MTEVQVGSRIGELVRIQGVAPGARIVIGAPNDLADGRAGGGAERPEMEAGADAATTVAGRVSGHTAVAAGADPAPVEELPAGLAARCGSEPT